MKERDRSVIRRMQLGDWEAFGELFEEYSQRLYGHAYGFLGDRQAAEDVIQDAFVWLWTHRERIEWHDATYGYLFRAVRNACINHKARQLRTQRYSADIDPAAPQDETTTGDDSLYALYAKIATLPPKCREIFTLATIDDLPLAKIASRLDISINTVKKQLQRAKEKLRQK